MWVEWQTNRETNLTPKQYSAWGAKHDMKENTSMRTLSLALHLCFTSFHLISKTFITWPGLYHALLAHWGRAWVWVPTRSSFMHGSWDPEVWGNQKCLDKQTCSVVRDVLFGALDNRTLCSFCSRLGSIVNHEKHLKWNSTKSEQNLQRLMPGSLEGSGDAGKRWGAPRQWSAVNGMYCVHLRTTNGHVTPLKARNSRPHQLRRLGSKKIKAESCFRFPKVFIRACVTILVRIGCGFTWRHHVQLAAKPEPCDFTLERSCFQPENRVWRTWCEGEIVRASSERTISTSIACSIPGIVNRWYGKGCAWQMARSWWCESFWLQQFPPKICFLIVFDWFWDLHPLPACMAWGCGTGYPAARGAVYLRSKGRSLKTQWDWALNLFNFFKGRPWVANSCLWGPCDAGKVWGW